MGESKDRFDERHRKQRRNAARKRSISSDLKTCIENVNKRSRHDVKMNGNVKYDSAIGRPVESDVDTETDIDSTLSQRKNIEKMSVLAKSTTSSLGHLELDDETNESDSSEDEEMDCKMRALEAEIEHLSKRNQVLEQQIVLLESERNILLATR
mmetsp:Transcript_4582/g.6854  ORF Transcript_4582/g.6854 Transcript_4582/m.6854 type:complete len:154 (-) Transcript_4582:213-674(-)